MGKEITSLTVEEINSIEFTQRIRVELCGGFISRVLTR